MAAPRWLHAALPWCCALLAACASAPAPAPSPGQATAGLPADRPEQSSGRVAKPGWRFGRQAVVAAHPLAAEAGATILRQGGSALDAAIAAQMVLGLVEPQSSGIGGGGFLVHWDGRSVEAWDGRETAPAAADERMFLDAAGRPLAFEAALRGGLAVGTPGLVRLLEAAHRRHGTLPWAHVFEPAIALAEQGFAVTPRLHRLLQDDPQLRRDPFARALFYDADGRALAVGARLRNPEYAAVLREIAAHGADALHRGPIARAIVGAVRGRADQPGRLSEADLAAYAPQRRTALCAEWQQHRLCGMPPPSGGTIAVAQILGITQLAGERLAAFPALGNDGLPTPLFLHVYTDASRLAFADRDRYVADPDFVPAPAGNWTSLVAPQYLARRAALIGPTSLGRALPGVPDGATPLAWADDESAERPSTSHLAAVDAAGHVVSMTSSIEQQFGVRLMVNRGLGLAGGFLLNNQLTDFSFVPEQDGRPVANRVQGGKRPRSSMSPLLVSDRASGAFQLATGSAGGPAIIHHTAKSLLGFDWGLTPQQAADLPNFGSFNGPTWLERDRFPEATWSALRARGHRIEASDLPSGVHTLMRASGGGWVAGADPRREGAAAGD